MLRTLPALLITGFASTAAAQSLELPQPSPKARVEQRVGLTDFSVDYSSPGVKKRKIWGGLVPFDELWRTGANAATKLTASKDFTFGGAKVTAGSYALYTIPGKQTWTVILSTNTNAWGTNNYDKKSEIARITVKPVAIPHRERLAFIFSNTTDDETSLDLEWEKLRIPIEIQVPTKEQALANIQSALDGAWRTHFASARYLLDNGGDLGKALEYVDASIDLKATWWNHWVKAQILAKQGRTAEAISTGEMAQTLGKDDRVYNDFFKKEVEGAVAGWKKKS